MSPRWRIRQLHRECHPQIIDAINPTGSLSPADQSHPERVADSRAQHETDVVCSATLRQKAAGPCPEIIRLKQDQIRADERCRAVLTNDCLTMECSLPLILQQPQKR